MVKKIAEVCIYVEGSGPKREQQARFRRALQELCKKMGYKDRMPTFKASGTRRQAYEDFTNALKRNSQAINILLVDSEDIVEDLSVDPQSDMAWVHLQKRDGWRRPLNTEPYQALIMATSMETWIATDHKALKDFFGNCLQESALFPLRNIEARTREAILDKLKHATRNCGKDKKYEKGDTSFKILETLDPAILHQNLSQFQRLKATLDIVLST